MSTKDIETYCPDSSSAWREWLEKNHESKESIWLVYYRTSACKPTLTWSQAVDQALCFGWIDSTKKTLDNERYMQYFCKRKPKSNWSKVNKEKVTNLLAQGLIKDAGKQSIAIAKENGSWNYLDSVEALELPDDLKEALSNYSGALEYYDSLSNSAKKLLLYWVHSAKRAPTREKRILEVAKSASQGLKPKPFR